MSTMFPLPPFEHVTVAREQDVARWATSTVSQAMAARPDASASGAAIVRAGGVDVLDLMKQGVLTPSRLVDIRRIPSLGQLRTAADGTLGIGACVTLERLAGDDAIRRHHTALADAAAHTATPQLRHVSTIGGNLLQRPRCWYLRDEHVSCRRKGGQHCPARDGEHEYHAIFDNARCAAVHASTPATALLALDARVEVRTARGEARTHELSAFLLAPGEAPERDSALGPGDLLTAVLLPPPVPGRSSAHIKQGQRTSYDWALVDVAVVLDRAADQAVTRARIALGSVAPTPRRALDAEALLLGAPVTADRAARAGRAALAGVTPLARNGYKLPLLETVVTRAILRAAGLGR